MPAWVRWLPLTAGVIWGTAFPAIEIALRTFNPLDVAFWRATLGTLSLGGWLVLQGRLLWRLPFGTWLRLVVLALTGAGLFWPMQITAVRLSTPVNVAFLISAYPAMIAILAPLILGESLRRRDVGSLLLALAGAYLIISEGRLLDLFASRTLPGDTFALLAGFSFAVYIVLGRRWRDSTMNISSQTLSLYTFLLSVPLLAALTLVDAPTVTPPTTASIGAVLWLGLMPTTVAFLAINKGMSVGVVSRSSVHLLIIPLVAAILSWVLFGTTLTPPQWVGGALVLAGIAIASR